jgi:hypothetical protein
MKELVPFGIVNSDDSTILGVNCGTGIGAHSGVFVHGLTSDGIENALPTPSASPAPQVEPICGAYSVQEQVCQGYIAPTYTMSGAAATSSFHCVYGNVTASSASETLTLTNSAVFETAPVEVSGVDLTAGTVMPTTSFSAVGTSSITFSATSAHSYYVHICGF